MALRKKVYGVKTPISAPIFNVQGVVITVSKSRKAVAAQSKVGDFGRLQLKLELVCDQGDEFGVCGFSFGIAHRIAEKSLQSIQIATIPGYFDGMADGTLHPAGGGLECLGDLGVQYLCDGIGGLAARQRGC